MRFCHPAMVSIAYTRERKQQVVLVKKDVAEAEFVASSFWRRTRQLKILDVSLGRHNVVERHQTCFGVVLSFKIQNTGFLGTLLILVGQLL